MMEHALATASAEITELGAGIRSEKRDGKTVLVMPCLDCGTAIERDPTDPALCIRPFLCTDCNAQKIRCPFLPHDDAAWCKDYVHYTMRKGVLVVIPCREHEQTREVFRETFDRADPTVQPEAHVAALEWIGETRPGRSLILMGRPGAGKSFYARAICERAHRERRSWCYTRATDLAQAFRTVATNSDLPALDLIGKARNASVLALDDLGKEHLAKEGEYWQSNLHELIDDRRIRGHWFVIATELNETQMEARYGAALVSRIFGGSSVVIMRPIDLRRV